MVFLLKMAAKKRIIQNMDYFYSVVFWIRKQMTIGIIVFFLLGFLSSIKIN